MRAPLEFDDELPSLSRLSPGKSPAYGPCRWKMAGYKDRSPENADARDCIIAPEGHSEPRGSWDLRFIAEGTEAPTSAYLGALQTYKMVKMSFVLQPD